MTASTTPLSWDHGYVEAPETLHQGGVRKEAPHRDGKARRPVSMAPTKEEYEAEQAASALERDAARRQWEEQARPKPKRQTFGVDVDAWGTPGSTGVVRSRRERIPAGPEPSEVCERCWRTRSDHAARPKGSYACNDFLAADVPLDLSELETSDAPPLPMPRPPSVARRAQLLERARSDAADRQRALYGRHDPPEGRRWCANADDGCTNLARQGETRCAKCARRAQRARREK